MIIRGRNDAPGGSIRNDPTTWIVTDDWPENVLVSEAERAVTESWFGDLSETARSIMSLSTRRRRAPPPIMTHSVGAG
jgi:hypothetical protein